MYVRRACVHRHAQAPRSIVNMPKVRRGKLSARRKAATRQRTKTSTPSETQEARDDHAQSVAPAESTSNDHGVVSTNLVSSLRKLFVSHVSTHPECTTYAPWIKKYMRNQFEFYGIKAPALRSIQKEFVTLNQDKLQRSLLLDFVPLLWEQEEREYQTFGQNLLSQFRQEILGTSDEEFHEAVQAVKKCITTKSWWDTVDMISYPVIGYFVKQRPSLGVPLMNKWIKDDNMWLRRVAILHQIGQKEKTDEQLLFSFCLERSHETEFFICKAIGWALREYSKSNKKTVRQFVEQNKDSLSKLSVREALKHC